MRIGLIDIDSKIPNLALMKLSAWHKAQGDLVEFHMPLWKYDKIYASKIFNFTDSPELPENCIKGGSGFDLTSKLPNEIENIYPDYSLYRCEFAIGFLTRGCSRKCDFCIVPKKEGNIKRSSDISSFWKDQSHIMLLDNNLTAHPDCIDILKDLQKTKAKINISQGLDLRLMTPEIAQELVKLKRWKNARIHFAWDDVRLEKSILKGLDIVLQTGIHPDRLSVYILIGYNSTPEEDLYRVEILREKGVNSYIMPFDKSNIYQKRFTRWGNHKAIFKSVKWADYKN